MSGLLASLVLIGGFLVVSVILLGVFAAMIVGLNHLFND